MIKPAKAKHLKENHVLVWRCNLCSEKPISLGLIVSEVKVLRHLVKVHDIIKPELGIHYEIAYNPRWYGYGDYAQFGYDFVDDKEDNDEDSDDVDEERRKEDSGGENFNEEDDLLGMMYDDEGSTDREQWAASDSE
ncbi:hypothetical protein FRC11_010992 [Ceratobasidium sp. 423]|nr:hypothetical protein FRC11_010992 [Ceratobasidium sp. 423]